MFYAALDVSLRSVSICIIDGEGKIQYERSVPSEVPDVVGYLQGFGHSIHQVGFEAGTLSQHLTYGLREAGYDVQNGARRMAANSEGSGCRPIHAPRHSLVGWRREA